MIFASEMLLSVNGVNGFGLKRGQSKFLAPNFDKQIVRLVVVRDLLFRRIPLDRAADNATNIDQVRDARDEMSDLDRGVWILSRLNAIEPVRDMVFRIRTFKRGQQVGWIAGETPTVDLDLAPLADEDAAKGRTILTLKPDDRTVGIIKANATSPVVVRRRGRHDARRRHVLPAHGQVHHVESMRPRDHKSGRP